MDKRKGDIMGERAILMVPIITIFMFLGITLGGDFQLFIPFYFRNEDRADFRFLRRSVARINSIRIASRKFYSEQLDGNCLMGISRYFIDEYN